MTKFDASAQILRRVNKHKEWDETTTNKKDISALSFYEVVRIDNSQHRNLSAYSSCHSHQCRSLHLFTQLAETIAMLQLAKEILGCLLCFKTSSLIKPNDYICSKICLIQCKSYDLRFPPCSAEIYNLAEVITHHNGDGESRYRIATKAMLFASETRVGKRFFSQQSIMLFYRVTIALMMK